MKVDIDDLTEELVDTFVATILESGDGTPVADAWGYYEREYRDEDLNELKDAIKQVLIDNMPSQQNGKAVGSNPASFVGSIPTEGTK